MGLEPTRYCYHRHLKPARLPIPPLLHLLLSLRFCKHKEHYTIICKKSQDYFEKNNRKR